MTVYHRDSPTIRLREVGPHNISVAETLACLLTSGAPLQLAHALLGRFTTLRNLSSATENELMQVKGIGPANAACVRAAFEIRRRLVLEESDLIQIRSPADLASLFPEMRYLEYEQFVVVMFNTKQFVVDSFILYKGTVDSTNIRVAEVFREPVKRQATSIALIHNHPSGDPTPSPEDIAETKRVIDGGRLLDIVVTDHIIMAKDRFISLRERGLGGFK